ncbi:MAG TPA: AMP-binding protein [Oscillospiraceae bacterium]|nr:AMP-binding protein [Oscillospiraceae bacterium]
MEIITGKAYYQAPPIYHLRDLLIESQKKFKDRISVAYREKVSDKDPATKTYDDLYRDVVRMQDSLSKTTKAGSRIAVIGDNSYKWMVTYLAVASGFGTIVPLDRLLKPEELGPMLERSKASVVVYDAPFHELMQSLKKDNDNISHTIFMESEKLTEKMEAEIRSEHSADSSFFFFNDFMANADCEADLESADPDSLLWEAHQDDETCAILFTSGTSSSAKAVMLTEKNLCSNVRALLGSVSFDDNISALSVLPLHHTFENTCGFLTMLAIGARIDICDGLRYVSKNLKEYQTYIMIAVPALLTGMKRAIENQAKRTGQYRKLRLGLRLSRSLHFVGIDLRRKIFKDVLSELGGKLQVIISGAASLDKETLRFFDALGVDVLQGYGLTEASPVVSGGNTKVNVLGTVGQPISGITVAIDNDKKGEPGEILVYADTVMKGYLDDEVSTKEAIDEAGWLHTGDIGRMGRRNSISITGRSKSMIVLSSGKKVFPEELETLLKQGEYIKDSLVFGQETDSGDVIITAKLVLDEERIRERTGNHDGVLNEADISDELALMIDEINRSLPSFKGIRSYFYSFQDMIQTTTMKVRRGMEMDNLKVLYEQSKENWQALRGANIDKLTAAAEESQNSTEAKDNTSGLTAEGSDKKVAKPEKENSILENMRLKELKRARHRYYRELRVINRMRENIEKRRGLLAEDERNLEICEAVLKQRLNKIKQTIEVDGSASPKALLQEN